MGRLMKTVGLAVGWFMGSNAMVLNLTKENMLSDCMFFECANGVCGCEPNKNTLRVWYAAYFSYSNMLSQWNVTEMQFIKDKYLCDASEVIDKYNSIFLMDCGKPMLQKDWPSGTLYRFKPYMFVKGGSIPDCAEVARKYDCMDDVYDSIDGRCRLDRCRIDDQNESFENVIYFFHRRVIQNDQFKLIVNDKACLVIQCFAPSKWEGPDPYYPFAKDAPRLMNCTCPISDPDHQFNITIESKDSRFTQWEACNLFKSELSCRQCECYDNKYCNLSCLSVPDQVLYDVIKNNQLTSIKITNTPRKVMIVHKVDPIIATTTKVCVNNRLDLCWTDPLPLTCKYLAKDFNCQDFALVNDGWQCNLYGCVTINWTVGRTTPRPTGLPIPASWSPWAKKK